MVENLDNIVIKNLLVIHAFSGCDTTSSIYDKGKNCILKLLRKNNNIIKACDILMDSNSTQDDVGNAGIDIFKELYGSKGNAFFIYHWFKQLCLLLA